MRIDPNAGPIGGGGFPVGAVDLTVDLNAAGGPAALPYNYSDMTGFVAIGSTAPSGTWTTVFDGGSAGIEWGTVTWNQEPQADEPPNTSIAVEVRAADAIINLSGEVFVPVSNGASFSGVTGQFIEIRATLSRSPGVQVTPVLSDLTVESAIQFVNVDIKPQSCPNPLNTKDKGVIPVAILGTDDFDVTQVDASTVKLEGVPALRSSLEDAATPFLGEIDDCLDCTTEGPDGKTDLSLKFDARAVIAALGEVTDGECRGLTVTGKLIDGTNIQGEDVVRIQKSLKKEEGIETAGVPKKYTLHQNHPNPFNPETEIRFQLPQASHVVLKIFNTVGEEVRTLAEAQYQAGDYSVSWDGKDKNGNPVSSGVYLYQLQVVDPVNSGTGNFSQVKKMSLLRCATVQYNCFSPHPLPEGSKG